MAKKKKKKLRKRKIVFHKLRKTTFKSSKKVRTKEATKTRWDTIRENHKYVLDYLLEHPCVDCGEKDIVVLEFDHIDPSKKLATISSLLHRSLMIVKEEIAKCDIRCCNCHRRRTAKQFGWKRLTISESRSKN